MIPWSIDNHRLMISATKECVPLSGSYFGERAGLFWDNFKNQVDDKFASILKVTHDLFEKSVIDDCL